MASLTEFRPGFCHDSPMDWKCVILHFQNKYDFTLRGLSHQSVLQDVEVDLSAIQYVGSRCADSRIVSFPKDYLYTVAL